MSPQRFVPILLVAASLGGCSLAPKPGGVGLANATHRPVAAATAFPAPAGNPALCGSSGPTGDAPVPRGPADTVRVRVKSTKLTQVLSAFCSYPLPVPKATPGSTKQPGL